MNPYLQLNQEMEDDNIFDILAKNTDKDKQNKARKIFVALFFILYKCICADPALYSVHRSDCLLLEN